MPSPRTTIDDVAKVAGVSKSTVSRILNGQSRHIRAETRERVLEAIERLQYRPSSIARSLVSNQTRTVGILVSDIQNPYYPDVIHGIEDQASKVGYSIFLCNTNYDLERGMELVRSLVDKSVDGVLIMSSAMSDQWLVELNRNRVPTVVVDWKVSSAQLNVSAIKVDFQHGITEAVEHLVSLGHRTFAHVSGPMHLPTSRLRQECFLQALQRQGIDPREVALIEGNLNIDGGRMAVESLLSAASHPTAVFTANDLTAVGLVWALNARGLRVPEDLSVVGLDDVWLVREFAPPLTTIALPRYEIGEMAMRMVLKLIDPASASDDRNDKLFIAHTHLVVRASTSAPPQR